MSDESASGTGTLVFVGRSDFQVKVRGQRLELGEVEAALTGLPRIAQAVVAVHSPAEGDGVRLVAYVVAAAGYAVDPVRVRQAVADRLPAYMVPDVVILLDELPLTGSGKVDRRALPEPVFTSREYRAPSTRAEKIVAGVFAEVLDVRRVSADDDFFALGGDSIVSIQVVAKARARGVVFTPRDVFEQRTAAGLALIAVAADTEVPTELPGGGLGAMPLLPVARWMVEWDKGFDRFEQHMVVPLPVGITESGLVAALGALLDRHDMLRSRLERGTDGEWSLVVGARGSVDAAALLHRVVFDAGVDDETAAIAAGVDSAARGLDPMRRSDDAVHPARRGDRSARSVADGRAPSRGRRSLLARLDAGSDVGSGADRIRCSDTGIGPGGDIDAEVGAWPGRRGRAPHAGARARAVAVDDRGSRSRLGWA